jgi:hypothetical protein
VQKVVFFMKKRGKKRQKTLIFRQNMAEKRCLGLKWVQKGSKLGVITAFSGVFWAFLGRKVYQMYQLFHLFRGTVQTQKPRFAAGLCWI